MQLPALGQLLIVISNALIFFQDLVMFTAVDQGQLVFTSNFRNSEIAVYGGLLVPQAWSLSLELTFYAIAPFILRKRNWLLGLLILSIFERTILIFLGLGFQDPWSYRFFPVELGTFLVGALTHQIGMPLFRKLNFQKKIIAQKLTVSLVTTILLCFPFIPWPEIVKSAILFIVVVPLLPALFEIQGVNKFDKRLASLSYPVYMWHVLLVTPISILSAQYLKLDIEQWTLFWSVLIISLVLGILSNKFLDEPIQGIRSQIRKRSNVRQRPN